jgi:hypothetical protein
MADPKDSKKASIKMSVPNEPKSENPNGKALLKAAKASGPSSPEARVAPGIVISTNDHPVPVKYGESSIRMSPRARQPVADWNKLPSQLPAGIHLKKLSA